MAQIRRTHSFVSALKGVRRFYELRGVPEETLQHFFDREIFTPIERLAHQPEMGRKSPQHNAYRELICAGGDLLILYRYRPEEQSVYLVDIFSAQQA